MKILLTGATGLLGGSLGRKLFEQGHEIVALVRHSNAQPAFPARVQIWSEEQELPDKLLREIDGVIHLAGENIASQRWTEARKKALVASRIDTAHALGAAFISAGHTPHFVISASATGFYGDRGDDALDEFSRAGNDFLAHLCVEWEKAARSIPAERHVITRFGVVLSAEGGYLRQVAPLFTMLGASRLGSGRAWFSWIHIEDLTSILALAVNDSSLEGVYNAVAPDQVTNSALTDGLKESLMTYSAPPIPAIALKLIYGELATALLSSQRVVPKRLEQLNFKWHYPSLREALTEIFSSVAMGEIKLVYIAYLHAPPKEVWPFFSNEANLERLTPPFLRFKVIGKNTAEIEVGTLIDYQLKLHGLPLKWRTRIAEWQKEQVFVDEQVSGPYQKWHHRHEFQRFGQGTLMRDTIHLKMKAGWIGRVVGLIPALSQVETIFSFRTKIIGQIFLTR